MKINIERITTDEAMQRAFSATVGRCVKIDKVKALRSEHSPIRCLWYWIEFKDVTQRAVNHLTRHKIGVEWFVKTSRPDRGGKEDEHLRDMACMINAQALIAISRARLCNKAWFEASEVWQMVKNVMWYEDPAMANAMVPNCMYRGACPEIKPCGRLKATPKPIAVQGNNTSEERAACECGDNSGEILKALEYIAYAGLSARHCEDIARDALQSCACEHVR